jgi:hypothetical protein
MVCCEGLASDSERTIAMAYPQELNSKIRIHKNALYRDIADAHGFDVIHDDGGLLTLIRNRPENIKLKGHVEFLKSLPANVLATADANAKVVD